MSKAGNILCYPHKLCNREICQPGFPGAIALIYLQLGMSQQDFFKHFILKAISLKDTPDICSFYGLKR